MSEEQNPGLIGEIVDGLHNLEKKVEGIIHPADMAPIDNLSIAIAAASLPSVNQAQSEEAGGAAQNPTDASGQIPAPALGTQSDAGAADSASGDTGNASDADTGSSASAGAAIGTSDAPAVAASGEGVASDAASTSIIESASSVLPASLAGAAAVVGVYAFDQIKARIASIKQQLDVHHFEQSVVAGIHAELDAIEGML